MFKWHEFHCLDKLDKGQQFDELLGIVDRDQGFHISEVD